MPLQQCFRKNSVGMALRNPRPERPQTKDIYESRSSPRAAETAAFNRRFAQVPGRS